MRSRRRSTIRAYRWPSRLRNCSENRWKRSSRRDPGIGFVRCLYWIPIEQANFDACALQRLLEHRQIGSAVVIRDYDFRMECFDGVGGLVRGHGVGKVHADECDVDIL